MQYNNFFNKITGKYQSILELILFPVHSSAVQMSFTFCLNAVNVVLTLIKLVRRSSNHVTSCYHAYDIVVVKIIF
jgi:hypothetical protein